MNFLDCETKLQSIVDSLAEDVSKEEWSDFLALFHLKTYPKGSYFSVAGDKPIQIGFVCSGVIRAFYRNAEGTEYNKTFFTKHSFVAPLRSLITGSVNQINQQALVDSKLLVADYPELVKLYDRHQSLERFARKAIEIEWCKKELREIRLVLNSAEERYDFFLSDHPGLENLIPQYHIASYLGITPVALSRIRKRRTRRS